ncbi:MAG: hypothetical protein J0H83_08595 [Candidatus Melainabacteria bacterium]|jgi:hypothetical protein|nr:hypothetical protein [Candidatus Melainabacteria bacterium]MBX9674034.1 hypothetical protein [Candidatus Obscuribacterales bacterium]
MNFDPASYESIEPAAMPFQKQMDAFSLAQSVEKAIENTIVESIMMGSGGPENLEITDHGLRFVRHLLSSSKSMRYGFMPNLKNIECIRELARDYIRKCGNGPLALDNMYDLMHKPQAS